METKKRKTTDKNTSAKSRAAKPKQNAADGLRDLLIDSMKDIYWAEKALTKALPKMAKNASSENLITTINDHLFVTEDHVIRLEKVFDLLGEKAVAKKCDAMQGLIEEGEGMLKETQPGAVRDAAIIAASQKIEHYEIATYGTLAAFARTLIEDEAAELLEQTLEEEKEADVALTEVAYNNINFEAVDDDEKDDNTEER